MPEVNIALKIPTRNVCTFHQRRLSCSCVFFLFRSIFIAVSSRSQQNTCASHECHNTSDRTTFRQSRSSSGLQSGADDPAGDQHLPCWHRGQVTLVGVIMLKQHAATFFLPEPLQLGERTTKRFWTLNGASCHNPLAVDRFMFVFKC